MKQWSRVFLQAIPWLASKLLFTTANTIPLIPRKLRSNPQPCLSYKAACAKASPVLIEPIYRYEVLVPNEYMGDIMGDMSRRRGRLIGTNPTSEGTVVIAEAPLSEMFKYATDLRSMTQGRGSFTSEFVRYEDVPANVAQKIIESAKKDDEDDE